MDVNQIVGALVYLEGKFGKTPSTKEIAQEADCSEATAIKYLQRAKEQGLIIQRDGKYMSHQVARAFDAQKGK